MQRKNNVKELEIVVIVLNAFKTRYLIKINLKRMVFFLLYSVKKIDFSGEKWVF